LLAHPDAAGAVRLGDVFGLLVDKHYSCRDLDQALTVVDKMRARGVPLQPYIDAAVLRDLTRHAGVDSSSMSGPRGRRTPSSCRRRKKKSPHKVQSGVSRCALRQELQRLADATNRAREGQSSSSSGSRAV
jgi:hypothetical protein